MSIEAMKQALEALESFREISDFTPAQAVHALTALREALAEAERLEHAEQLSLKGWQYFECPACGSQGARGFPKPEQEASRPIYMAEVTMPDPDIWCHGKAECLNCGHEWTAVWPLAAESLECPRCGSTDTDRDQAGPHRIEQGLYGEEVRLYTTPLAAQPAVQEPVKHLCTAAMFEEAFLAKSGLDPNTKLYTSSPAAQRQPLTDEQIWQITNDCVIAHDLHADKFARAIEAAHGIGEKK